VHTQQPDLGGTVYFYQSGVDIFWLFCQVELETFTMGEIGAGKNDSPNIKNMGKGADSDKLAEVVRDQQEERRKSPTKEPMKISAETGSQDPKAKQF
jgi:hypothetical protein